MRYLFALTLLLLASPALAAPFLVCDSYESGVIPTHFLVVLDGAPEVSTPAWSGTVSDGTNRINAIHFDVGGVSNGNHTGTVRACLAADVWYAERCSDPSPFDFTRPAGGTPAAPSGFGVSK